MEYKKIGKTELQVSRVGFGCMSLSGDMQSSSVVLHKALDLGINYFDTADLYENGANEEKLGAVLQEKRKGIIIATKVGNQMKPDGSGWDWNPRKDYILKAIEGSLKRLKTDYIDLYQLHGGTLDDPIEETIEAFEILKQAGKIRYYGISSIRPNVIREYVQRSSIISVMMQYSLLDRRPEETCLDLLEKYNIAIMARGSVAQGLLISKEAKPYVGRTTVEVKRASDAIAEISGDQRSKSAAALLFTLQNPAITSAVVGARTIEQLEDAVKVFDATPLSDQEIAFLKENVPPNFYTEHR